MLESTQLTLDAYSDILIEERQLGNKLNECVEGNRRYDFSLMLAMLTEDVQAHSQFKLPQQSYDSTPTTNERLRKAFMLPKAASLSVKNKSDVSRFNQASNAELDQLATIRLAEAISAKPIAFRDDAKHIETDVLTNMSLYHQKQSLGSKAVERLPFDANNWLNAVKDARMRSLIA